MSKFQKAAPQQLVANDPLFHPFKRAKVARRHVERIVPATGRSAFGHLTRNWIGAGMMTRTLRAIFESEDTVYVQAREDMKAKGFAKRPKQLQFDVLALIESSFPELISRKDLADRLNRSPQEVDGALTYLREFAASMCGINILSNGKGEVGIADAALWMVWQNRMARLSDGLRKSQERHGLTEQNMTAQRVIVKEQLPMIQPLILAEEASA